MEEAMKRKFMILFILLLLAFTHQARADTIIDTLYSVPELDGGIGYLIGWDRYGVDTTYGLFVVGDWYSQCEFDHGYSRGFLCFPLPSVPENYFLNNATIFLYQKIAAGNDQDYIYPIFNLLAGDIEPPCLIEHVDYGFMLDADDFNAKSLDFIGVISTTPEKGWRTKEVTDNVLDDMKNKRSFSQYRLRLVFDSDLDPYTDALWFSSGNSSTNKPYIVYEYIENTGLEQNQISFQELKLSNYPNPFNLTTTISFELPKNTKGAKLQIFNVKGQLVKTLPINEMQTSIQWNGKDDYQNQVSSGIYFYRINSGDYLSQTKKMILMK